MNQTEYFPFGTRLLPTVISLFVSNSVAQLAPGVHTSPHWTIFVPKMGHRSRVRGREYVSRMVVPSTVCARLCNSLALIWAAERAGIARSALMITRATERRRCSNMGRLNGVVRTCSAELRIDCRANLGE